MLPDPLRNPYYIDTPDYKENSEGVRAVHYLCHALNMAGYEAFASGALIFNPDLQTPALTVDICRQHEQEGKVAIGVYPEIAKNNRLDTPIQVRYMLNKDGVITGNKMKANHDDLFFYYSKLFTPERDGDFDLLAPPNFDLDLFKPNDNVDKKSPLLYLNRVSEDDVEFSGLPENIEILSNRRPLTLKTLAKKLQETPVLYTYEFSGTCSLAILCGCPVVVLIDERYEQYIPDINLIQKDSGYTIINTPESINAARKKCPNIRFFYQAQGKVFQQQLRVFIEKTQAASRNAVMGNHSPSRALLKMADYLRHRGLEHFSENNFEDAEFFLRSAIAKRADPLSCLHLAIIKAIKGDAEFAELFIRQALLLSPNSYDFLAILGNTFLQAGQHKSALRYLREAVDSAPNLFMAYVPLAHALLANGEEDEAIHLLLSVAGISSEFRDEILDLLVARLIARGDISSLVDCCLRCLDKPAFHALGLALAPRTDIHPDKIRHELHQHGARYWSAAPPSDAQGCALESKPPIIALLVSDLYCELLTGRLSLVLRHLASEGLAAFVLLNARESEAQEMLPEFLESVFCIADLSDADVSQALLDLQVGVLVDMDGLGIKNRLSLFFAAPVSRKFSWSDTALLSELGVSCFLGKNLTHSPSPPLIKGEERICDLPELGEPFVFPEIVIEKRPAGALTLGCVTAATCFSHENWRFLSVLLQRNPELRLTINLADLAASADAGQAAQVFIENFFAAQGVDAPRLNFVAATSIERICAVWNAVDVGFAPFFGPGDVALPLALWMEKPYFALTSPACWSQRPAAWLKSLGLREFIVDTPDDLQTRVAALTREKLAICQGLREKMRALSCVDSADLLEDFATRLHG